MVLSEVGVAMWINMAENWNFSVTSVEIFSVRM